MPPRPTFFWSLLGSLLAFRPDSPFVAVAPLDKSPLDTVTQAQLRSSWPGWAGIEHWFAFGDSYTSTHFDRWGAQPDATNPLGNPPFPGDASCNGTNWLGALSTIYNQSEVKVYNMAVGGATINSNTTAQLYGNIESGADQVHGKWVPTYVDTDIPWTSRDTLFSFWFSVNDIIATASLYDASKLAQIAVEYRRLLETVYAHGARNILIMYAPAFDTSPSMVRIGSERVQLVRSYLWEYNANLQKLATAFDIAHPDAKVFLLDTFLLFKNAQDYPQLYPETAKIRNTTDYCESYNMPVPTSDTFHAECGVPADQYFWHDELHPTATVHQLVAKVVAGLLTQNEAH